MTLEPRFDARLYLDPDAPFKVSVKQVRQMIAALVPTDPQRLQQIDPDFTGEVDAIMSISAKEMFSQSPWFPVGCSRFQHARLASQLIMADLSESWVATSDYVAEKYLTVHSIGVTWCYQRMGICTAVIDYLLHASKRQGYHRMMIEAVITPEMDRLLSRRKDCVRVYEDCFEFTF